MTSPMTPTTPPAIPSDIPETVAVAAVETMLKAVGNPVLRYYMPGTQARAIEAMQGILAAAQERGKLMERERAIAACERQKADFLSTEYAFNQPLGSLLERFACDECIEAIREGN